MYDDADILTVLHVSLTCPQHVQFTFSLKQHRLSVMSSTAVEKQVKYIVYLRHY